MASNPGVLVLLLVSVWITGTVAGDPECYLCSDSPDVKDVGQEDNDSKTTFASAILKEGGSEGGPSLKRCRAGATAYTPCPEGTGKCGTVTITAKRDGNPYSEFAQTCISKKALEHFKVPTDKAGCKDGVATTATKDEAGNEYKDVKVKMCWCSGAKCNTAKGSAGSLRAKSFYWGIIFLGGVSATFLQVMV